MAVAFFGEGLDISRVRTFRAEWFEQSRRSGQLVFRPGFETLLSWMQSRDLKLGIGTSSSRAEALANFAGHEALSRFDVLVTRDDVRKSKPAPDIYLLAMARLGMTPRETLILEDSPTGMRAALASGARAVMVPDQICPDAGLEAAAFAVVPRLDALVDIIKPLV
jgi:HAD superfamily hydrolase (TIGR01509 family)